MKGERIEEEVETSMNLGVDIYIPKNYISEENLRMTFYKKIASASTDDRLNEIRNELRDRFGALPQNVENLIRFVQVKRFAQHMGVVSIVREGARRMRRRTLCPRRGDTRSCARRPSRAAHAPIGRPRARRGRRQDYDR